MPHLVTGAGLLSLAADFKDCPKAQTVTAAGYIRPDGKPAYTAFYEALLSAQGKRPEPAPILPGNIARACGDGPAVYVACLASYNAGHLFGHWLDLSSGPDADDIREAIAAIIADSPAPDAEEWAIHDSQGLPGILVRTEWPDIDQLAKFCQVWADLPDDDEAEAYRLLCDDAGEILSESDFRDRFRGWYESPEDFVQELWAESGRCPDDLWRFINWESVWQEYDSDGWSADYVAGRGYLISCSA